MRCEANAAGFDLHAEQNHTVPSRDCPQNWSGSSKAMEADIAMSMAHQLADNDFMLQVNHNVDDEIVTINEIFY